MDEEQSWLKCLRKKNCFAWATLSLEAIGNLVVGFLYWTPLQVTVKSPTQVCGTGMNLNSKAERCETTWSCGLTGKLWQLPLAVIAFASKSPKLEGKEDKMFLLRWSQYQSHRYRLLYEIAECTIIMNVVRVLKWMLNFLRTRVGHSSESEKARYSLI